MAAGPSQSDWGSLEPMLLEQVISCSPPGVVRRLRRVCRHWCQIAQHCVTALEMSGAALTLPQVLQQCQLFSSLRSLDFLALRCEPSGLEVANLQLPLSLTHLSCPGHSSSNFEYVRRLTDLESLQLTQCEKPDSRDLRALLPLTRLRVLRLGEGFPLTDEGLEVLAELPALQQLSLNGNPAFPASTECRLLMTRLSGLTSLRFRGFEHWPNASLDWLQELPHLQHLDLQWSDVPDGCLSILARLRSLRSLAVPAGYDEARAAMCVLSALSALSQLTRLIIYSTLNTQELASPLVAVTACLSSLCELDLSDCRFLENSALQYLPAHLNRLTLLSLARCSALTDAAMATVARLPALAQLTVDHCRLTDAAFPAGILRMTGLRHLNMSACHITHAGLGPCLRALTRLTALDISNCWSMSDALLPDLRHLSSLRKLAWHGGRDLPVATVHALSKLPALVDLDLRFCTVVDAHARGLLERIDKVRL